MSFLDIQQRDRESIVKVESKESQAKKEMVKEDFQDPKRQKKRKVVAEMELTEIRKEKWSVIILKALAISLNES